MNKCFVLLLLGLMLIGALTIGCKNNNHDSNHTDHSTETQIERGHAPS